MDARTHEGDVVAAYLDEAVVKMEAEEGGGHAGVLGVRLADDGRHDLLRLRARVVVEVGLQLLLASPRKCEGGGEEEEGDQGDGGNHCTPRHRHRSYRN